MSIVYRSAVTFSSNNFRDGLFDLTCGQRYIWRIMQLLKSKVTYNIPLIFDISTQISLDNAKTIIGQLIERHEAFRTTFPLGDDGFPKQKVHCEGAVGISVYDVHTDDTHTVVQSIDTDWQSKNFSLEQEFPIRCAIVNVGQFPKHLVFSFSHLIVDNWSLFIIWQELSDAFSKGFGDGRFCSSWSPVDQVMWERSTEGQKTLNSALQYWARTVEDFPRATFYRSMDQYDQNRWQSAELHSTALGFALQSVARKVGVSTATILLTAFAVVLGKRTHTSTFSTSVLCFNRSTKNLEQAIGSYVQLVPVALDLMAADIVELLRNAHYSLLDAYTNSLAWPPAISKTVAEIEGRRGIEIELDTYFNIAHAPLSDGNETDGLDAAQQTASGGRPASKISRMAPWDFDIHTITVRSFSTESIFMRADTKYISEEDARQILRAVESLVIAIAQNSKADLRELEKTIVPMDNHSLSNWDFIDNTWIDLSSIQSFFADMDGVLECRVFSDENRECLTLYCVLNDVSSGLSGVCNGGYQKLLCNRSTMVPKKFIQLQCIPDGDLSLEQSWREGKIVDTITRGTNNTWQDKRSGFSLPC